jgi:hypothetical protein
MPVENGETAERTSFADTMRAAYEAAPEAEVSEAPEVEAPEAVEETSEGPTRDERGRFAPKPGDELPNPDPDPQPQPVPERQDDLPSWLKGDAKGEWAKAPPAVRGEVARRVGELETGLQQYREQIAPYQPFLEQARASGVDPVALVGRYVELDNVFSRQGPMAGFEQIARSFGTDMRTIAAQIMGQPAPEKDAQVAHLQRELQGAQQELQQLRGLSQRVQAERADTIGKTVTDFAASHPRFEELSDVIQDFIPTFKRLSPERALEAAYRLADQTFPAAAQTSAVPAAPAAPAPAAQTSVAHLSVSGAPSTGSNPAAAAPKSVREALQRSFAERGIPVS